MLLLVAFPMFTFAQNVNLSQGLISYYPFNYQGDPYADSSGFARDLTQHGTMTSTANRLGVSQQALQIIEGQLHDYTMKPLPNGNQPRSFSLWFNKTFPTQLEPNIQFLCFYGTMGTGMGCGLALDYTGTLYFAGFQDDIVQSFPLNFNTWYHVAGVYDGNMAFLYLDGNLIGQAPKNWATQGGILKLGALEAGIQGGGSQLQFTNGFTGSLDEVRVYNRKLNYNEIQVLAGKLISGNIEEMIHNETLTILPNPTSKQISFNFTAADLPKIDEVQILDATGRKVKTLQRTELLRPITVQAFPPGLYTVQVIGKRNVITRKFIKQ